VAGSHERKAKKNMCGGPIESSDKGADELAKSDCRPANERRGGSEMWLRQGIQREMTEETGQWLKESLLRRKRLWDALAQRNKGWRVDSEIEKQL